MEILLKYFISNSLETPLSSYSLFLYVAMYFYSLSTFSEFCIYIISNLTRIGNNNKKPINPYKIPFNAIEIDILNSLRRSVPSPIG